MRSVGSSTPPLQVVLARGYLIASFSSVVVLREPRCFQVQVSLQLWIDKVTHQDCRFDGVTVSPLCSSYCFSRSHLKIDSTSTDFGG